MPMGGAMPYNEPLDPFIADAVKRQRRLFGQQNPRPDAKRGMLQEIMLAMLPQILGMGFENILRMQTARMKAAEPMSPLDQAQLENIQADTKGKLAQAATRADENSPMAALRNTISMEEAKAGNVRGALDIAEGRAAPGSAPTIVARAGETRSADAQRMIDNSHKATDRAAGARQMGEGLSGMIEEIRSAHPGPAGEQLARDVGEMGVQDIYARGPGGPAEREELVRQALLLKLAQFGKGQEGVTDSQVRRGILRDSADPGFYQRAVGAIPVNPGTRLAPNRGWSPGY